jgi:hypothetical protein
MIRLQLDRLSAGNSKRRIHQIHLSSFSRPLYVTLLIALSIASERLVEIIKNAIPWLNQKNSDSGKEGWRKALLQALAVAAGILTAFLAGPAVGNIVAGPWDTVPGLLALGLLASGGSGLWNSILTYLLKVKDIKGAEAKKLETAGG